MTINNNKLSVGYLGIPGSYSYIAGILYFKKSDEFIGFSSFENIVSAVGKGKLIRGILPIENSLTGNIYETYDLLLSENLNIVGEIVLKVNHHLLAKKEFMESKLNINNLKKCYSHPQAFKQCKSFFINHKHILKLYEKDTATGAKKLKKEKITSAAISNRFAANIYKLHIVKENIGDHRFNFTRFVVIGKKSANTGNKVTMIFSVAHKPGSLVKALEPYAKYGFNLTRIESRPILGKPWEYIFVVDFEIDQNRNRLNNVINEMKINTNFIKVLGQYQKGNIYET